MTAAMLAAEKGCLMVVEFLAKVGANVDIKNNQGQTLFDIEDKTSGDQQEVKRKLQLAVQAGMAAAEKAAAEKAAEQAAEQAAAEEAQKQVEEEQKKNLVGI